MGRTSGSVSSTQAVSKDCKRFRSVVNPSLCGSSQTALISGRGLVVALIVNLRELQLRTGHSKCFTGKNRKNRFYPLNAFRTRWPRGCFDFPFDIELVRFAGLALALELPVVVRLTTIGIRAPAIPGTRNSP